MLTCCGLVLSVYVYSMKKEVYTLNSFGGYLDFSHTGMRKVSPLSWVTCSRSWGSRGVSSRTLGLSGGMTSELGPEHCQAHGPVLWEGQYPQRPGRGERGREKLERVVEGGGVQGTFKCVVVIIILTFDFCQGVKAQQTATGCNVHLEPLDGADWQGI